MKILAIISSAILCSSALAQSASFEEMISARVTMVEPMVVATYHRVPKNSCSVSQSIPESGGDARLVERCTTYQDVIHTQRITGYKVTYEHKGQLRNVIMRYDPGRNVMIRAVTHHYVLE
ncbi:hypothetical protein EBS02_00740 [bacterium]|nr:hypothetical protein [bacterium]